MADIATTIRSAIADNQRSEAALPPPKIRRATRIAARLKQTDVAGPVGVTRVSISRYESGEREPRGEVRRRYAEALEAMRDA